MITDARQQIAVSNLGWVDRGSVWTYDARTGRSDRVRLGEANSLTLCSGSADYFVAVHRLDGSRLEITIQPFDSPADTSGRITVIGGRSTLKGSLAAWDTVPAEYVGWLNQDAAGTAGYYLIRRAEDQVELTRLDWFGSAYDHGYQSVIAVEALPENGQLVFGVQRSSRLIVTDMATPELEIRQVELAGGFGNPVPHVRRGTSELWATDYDTVVRVDYRRWHVTGKKRLQEARGGVNMFVGDLWMPPAGDYVLVPRPGSGDVVFLSTVDLKVTRTVRVGDEPLVAVMLNNGQLLARDWKTGNVLVGAAG